MIADLHGSGQFASILPDYPDGSGVTRWHFSSVEDFARLIPDEQPPSAWDDQGWRPDRSITGTRTMQEARALVLEGWREGGANVERIARTIALQAPVARKVARYDVAGAVPSVPRFLAGDPRHMKRLDVRDTKRRPVLTLLANAASLYGCPAEQFTRAAGVAAAVVDRLEAAGFRVEVIGACRAYGSDEVGTADRMNQDPNRAEVAWRAKAPEDPLDVSRLAVSLGHPAMLRRFAFALFSMTKRCKRELRGRAYGRTIHFDQLSCRPAETFCLPGPSNLPSNDLGAFRVALETLRAQGCPGIPDEL